MSSPCASLLVGPDLQRGPERLGGSEPAERGALDRACPSVGRRILRARLARRRRAAERDKVAAEIRVEFRQNATEAQPERELKMIDEAEEYFREWGNEGEVEIRKVRPSPCRSAPPPPHRQAVAAGPRPPRSARRCFFNSIASSDCFSIALEVACMSNAVR